MGIDLDDFDTSTATSASHEPSAAEEDLTVDERPPHHSRIARFADSHLTPWRNGRGTTRLLRPAGEGSDAWWVTIADLVVAGPFSTFPGAERVFTPVRAAVDLVIDGIHQPAPAGCPLRFSGEAVVSLALPQGPALAVNVFATRGQCTLEVHVLQVQGSVDPGSALVVLGGVAHLADGRHLGPLDMVEGPAEVDGTVLMIDTRGTPGTPAAGDAGLH